MSRIAYDPTKDKFAAIAKKSRIIRRVLYFLLDMFFLRSWHVRRMLRDLKKERNINSILDAGSGFGQYDRHLLKIFRKATVKAVDVKQDYLEDSAFYYDKEIKKGRITFAEADLTKYEDDQKYDLVLCVDVLEHIEEDVEVMKNAHGVMNKGGFFVMHSPSHLAEEDAGDDEFFVDEHARAGYSREDLSAKFEKAGFEVFHTGYTYGKFGHASWEILIKYPMLWFTRFGFKTIIILPFYYLITLIPGLLLMRMDLGKQPAEAGTGIIGVARKK